MSKSYKLIPAEIKSQILLGLAAPSYSVAQLAKTYKVSTSYIYNLQKMMLMIRPIDESNPKSNPNHAPNFALLSVKDASNSHLKNASLTFAHCSLLLEGDIKASSLIAIIKILEEQSC